MQLGVYSDRFFTATLTISLGTGSVHRHYLVVLLPMIPIFLANIFNILNRDLANQKKFKIASTVGPPCEPV